MKKILILAAALVLSAPFAVAQEALPFIRTDRSVAVTALAGAGSASTTLGTAWSAFGNPAVSALAQERFDVSVSWQRWTPGETLGNNLSAGVSGKLFGRLGLQAGFATQMHSPVQTVSESGDLLSSVKPSEYIFGGGLSFAVFDFLSLGANVRYAIQILDPSTRMEALNADIMALFRWKELKVTAGVVGLGQTVKDVTGYSYAIPSSARLAADYVFRIADAHSIEAALDGDYYYRSKNFGASAGVQYAFKDMVFARAGYHYASAGCVVPSHAAFGAGFRMFGARIELSYLCFNQALANTFSVGLGYSF